MFDIHVQPGDHELPALEKKKTEKGPGHWLDQKNLEVVNRYGLGLRPKSEFIKPTEEKN
jgi:hypothetical protein